MTQDAAAWCKAGHGDGVLGHCLANVNYAFNAPHLGGSAFDAWQRAGGKDGPNTHTTKGIDPPKNVPVFWSGGAHGYGHVAVSDGAGYIWTTDMPNHGKFTRVKLSAISAKWGLTYLGWSETLNGLRVHGHVTLRDGGWR